jgi:hypothetical protein
MYQVFTVHAIGHRESRKHMYENCVSLRKERVYLFTRCQCGLLLLVLCSEGDPAAVLYKCDLSLTTQRNLF